MADLKEGQPQVTRRDFDKLSGLALGGAAADLTTRSIAQGVKASGDVLDWFDRLGMALNLKGIKNGDPQTVIDVLRGLNLDPKSMILTPEEAAEPGTKPPDNSWKISFISRGRDLQSG